jgi:hypothetical protein
MNLVIAIECQIANILLLRTVPGDFDLNPPTVVPQAEKDPTISLG